MGSADDKCAEYAIELMGGGLKYPLHSKPVFLCAVSQEVIVGNCVFCVCSIDELRV
jgi:hypothetical protein